MSEEIKGNLTDEEKRLMFKVCHLAMVDILDNLMESGVNLSIEMKDKFTMTVPDIFLAISKTLNTENEKNLDYIVPILKKTAHKIKRSSDFETIINKNAELDKLLKGE